jgi:hypothetical protein
MKESGSVGGFVVRVFQWAMAAGFTVFVVGIISWILHLIATAWTLGDVPSASIGISLVTIPIFIILLSVVLYVFWGLLTPGGKR